MVWGCMSVVGGKNAQLNLLSIRMSQISATQCVICNWHQYMGHCLLVCREFPGYKKTIVTFLAIRDCQDICLIFFINIQFYIHYGYIFHLLTHVKLKWAIIQVWALVTLEDCCRSLGSLPQRMKIIINAKGATIKHSCTNAILQRFVH